VPEVRRDDRASQGVRYHDRICCFNDDIQGSGAVVLAGMLSAMRITGGNLRDQTFLLLGAESAGIGIARMLVEGMMMQALSPDQARARIWLFNRSGLVESGRSDLADYQKPFAHSHSATRSFTGAIESIRPATM
jgi:malate dehydrogenase (oxaloacetate-decarboxylating)(NADP+)